MAKFFSKAFITQSFSIPTPSLTEQNLPDQTGRVHIVTGGYCGIGRELAAILFSKGATVYIAGRSEQKAHKAINEIQTSYPASSGCVKFLLLDLNDLSAVKVAAAVFTSNESRLDVLVNNAGVMFPPRGSKTRQGHDLQFGTNVLGPFLFTKLLMPTLIKTANTSPQDSVRILWASSVGIQVLSPRGGVVFDESGAPMVLESQEANYGQTKVGNVFLAIKIQELYGQHGIVSVAFNPGNLRTELSRHWNGLLTKMSDPMLHPPIYGAYTELFSGWSDSITASSGISFVAPWGRDGTQLIRSDIQEAIKADIASRLWEWCEKVTEPFC